MDEYIDVYDTKIVTLVPYCEEDNEVEDIEDLDDNSLDVYEQITQEPFNFE